MLDLTVAETPEGTANAFVVRTSTSPRERERLVRPILAGIKQPSESSSSASNSLTGDRAPVRDCSSPLSRLLARPGEMLRERMFTLFGRVRRGLVTMSDWYVGTVTCRAGPLVARGDTGMPLAWTGGCGEGERRRSTLGDGAMSSSGMGSGDTCMVEPDDEW